MVFFYALHILKELSSREKNNVSAALTLNLHILADTDQAEDIGAAGMRFLHTYPCIQFKFHILSSLGKYSIVRLLPPRKDALY